jgi:DUF1680 family protein
VKINGQEQPVKAVSGTYVTLARNWRANDTIELRMPFHFSLDHVVDQPNVASIFYGPCCSRRRRQARGRTGAR